jgi:hypothetical protein
MPDERPAPREIAGPDYIRASFHLSDRLAVLVRNQNRGATVQRVASAVKIAEPLFQDWLRFKNEKESCDIYIGMNALKATARTRTKDDIDAIRHLYVDLDHDGPASLEAIRESRLVPEPNYVLATSPGRFQVIWKVEDFTQERAEALLRAVTHKFHGDPAATDSTRVLRLPGFLNKKYESDFLVKAEQHADRTYHPFDFKLRADPMDSEHRSFRSVSSHSGSGERRPLSQSEHDWAYAKRALARGTDPEEVVRNIAEFRDRDKHDPLDYARRTVSKALADLRTSPTQANRAALADGDSSRETQH